MRVDSGEDFALLPALTVSGGEVERFFLHPRPRGIVMQAVKRKSVVLGLVTCWNQRIEGFLVRQSIRFVVGLLGVLKPHSKDLPVERSLLF